MYGVNTLLGKWLLERLGDGGGGAGTEKTLKGWTLMHDGLLFWA